MTPADQLCGLLRRVHSLAFVARSEVEGGWNGSGVGTVEVRDAGDAAVTFREHGTWQPDGGERQLRFTNAYRWTLAGDLVRLEHLQFGEATPLSCSTWPEPATRSGVPYRPGSAPTTTSTR